MNPKWRCSPPVPGLSARGHVVEAMMVNAPRHTSVGPVSLRDHHGAGRHLRPLCLGAASNLPFLPRIRYGRTVLRPANWNLSASDLPARRAAWPEWRQAWSGQRRRYRIPDAVPTARTRPRRRPVHRPDPHLGPGPPARPGTTPDGAPSQHLRRRPADRPTATILRRICSLSGTPARSLTLAPLISSD